MGIEITGKLHTINDTKQVSERFSKREFVVELADNPKYPQLVLFQLTGDRCAQLDDHKVGDEVRIEFSLRGREWRSALVGTKEAVGSRSAGMYRNRTDWERCSHPPLVLKTRAGTSRTNTPETSGVAL